MTYSTSSSPHLAQGLDFILMSWKGSVTYKHFHTMHCAKHLRGLWRYNSLMLMMVYSWIGFTTEASTSEMSSSVYDVCLFESIVWIILSNNNLKRVASKPKINACLWLTTLFLFPNPVIYLFIYLQILHFESFFTKMRKQF